MRIQNLGLLMYGRMDVGRLSHTDPEVVMKRTKHGDADLAKVGLGYRETRLRNHALGLALI